MKYPQLVDCKFALTEASYDMIIDVRSPAEYALDHLPGAINLAVLNDQQRQEVGTLYKQTGSFEAKRRGAALVAHNIAYHLETQLAEHPKTWRPLIYCWRGGNRSSSMAHIFAKIGWPVALLEGGYKAYRHHLLASLPQLIQQFKWICLSGPTGSGKSRLLRAMRTLGTQVLDLEELARHRGSLLGNLPEQAQPTQKFFETSLFAQLNQYAKERVVFVESESAKIGNLRLPAELLQAIRIAPRVQLETDLEQRVQLLKEDYSDWLKQPEVLLSRLQHFQTLVGKNQVKIWQQLVQENKVDDLINSLLARHYDVAYAKSALYQTRQNSESFQLHLAKCDESSLFQTARQLIDHLS